MLLWRREAHHTCFVSALIRRTPHVGRARAAVSAAIACAGVVKLTDAVPQLPTTDRQASFRSTGPQHACMLSGKLYQPTRMLDNLGR